MRPLTDDASENGPSLYSLSAVRLSEGPRPYPPGTLLTASHETIDNDMAALLVAAGVIR